MAEVGRVFVVLFRLSSVDEDVWVVRLGLDK